MLRLNINGTYIPLPANSGIALQKELYDPLKPGDKKSDYSKTFTVPGTPDVNKLFGHIWSLDTRIRTSPTAQFAPDYNPKKKATAFIDNDGLVLLRGFARLTGITRINETEIGYEVTVHGEQSDFFTAIRDKKMADLDFSDLNHTLSITAISDSWATQYKRSGVDTPANYGEGYFYPLIQTSDAPDLVNSSWLTSQFKPALYAREVVNKIMAVAGYEFSSDSFFNDTIFRHLFVPAESHAFDLPDAELTSREFQAEHTTGDLTLTLGTTLAFNNDSTSGNFDNGPFYDTATNSYTASIGGAHEFRALLILDATKSLGSVLLTGMVEVNVNGGTAKLLPFDLIYPAQSTRSSFTIDLDWVLQLDPADVVTLKLKYVKQGSNYLTNTGWTLKLKNGSKFSGTCTSHVWGPGCPVNFARFFKNEFTQEQFMSSLCRMFNLIIDTDKDNPKLLRFIPYNTFFSGVVSLQDKLNHGQELSTIPLGELTYGQYVFTYKKGADPESDAILQQYGDIYGTYRYTVPNDFSVDTVTIEPIFSSTPFYNDAGQSNIVVPWCSIGSTAEVKEGQIRLLYYAGLIDCGNVQLTIRDSFLAADNNFSQYPFSGHVDDPFAPTLDLCFGMPPVVNLAPSGTVTYTNNNLFNAYWRKFITQITDIDSVVVEGYFHLNPLDYYNLTFSTFYQFEGQNFRLLKVTDYDPEGDGLTKLTFLRASEPAAFSVETNKTGRGYDSKDADGHQFPAVKVKEPQKNIVIGGPTPTKGGIIKGKGNQVQPDSVFVLGDNNVVTGEQVVILSSDGTNISGDRSIAIQSPNETIENPDVLMVQGSIMDVSPATDGDVLTYNAGTNTWEAQAPTGATGGEQTIIKTVDQSTTGDDTLSNDSELFFPLVANATYNFRFRVYYDTTATADFKWALSGPAAPVLIRGIYRAFPPGSTSETIGNFVGYPSATAITGTGTTSGYIELDFIVQNGANAGNLYFQWAQNTSDGGNTAVLGGSLIEVVEQLAISPPSYSTRAQNYFNGAGISVFKSEIDDFFNALDAAGLIDLTDTTGASDKIQALYIPIHGSASLNKWNVLRPTDTDGDFRLTFYGGWTHGSGLQGNGSNAYADTHYDEQANMAANSGHMAAYSRTNSDGLYCTMGVIGGETSMFLKYSSTFYPRVQATNSGISNSGTSQRFFIDNRVSSTEIRAMQDSSLKVITNSYNAGSPNNIYIGAADRATIPDIAFYDPREYTIYSMGAGLTDTEMTNYTAAVDAFMLATGLNV